MCGWLKKLRKVKMVGQMRWVVLDGSKLMYYEDRAVSAQHQHATYDLEGSYSDTCPWVSAVQETRLKGVLHLLGCKCQASSQMKDLRRFTFDVVKGSGATLNQLNPGKHSYTYASLLSGPDLTCAPAQLSSATVASPLPPPPKCSTSRLQQLYGRQ